MAEYIIKDKVEWYKCKADITIGDKDFGNTGIVVIPVADISELPTIDIVHCAECKWWERKEDTKYGFCHDCQHGYLSNRWDISIDRKTKEEHFCADGERKNNG